MKERKKKQGLLRFILFLPAALVGIGLLLSALSGWVSPEMFFLPALCGLAFPVLLCSGFLLFIFNLCLLRKRCLFFLFCILVNYNPFRNSVQFKGRNEAGLEERTAENSFRLMSFNVRLFDFYHIMGKGEIKDGILEFVKEQSPDILCFQEYYETKGKGFDITSLLAASGYRYSTRPEVSRRGFLYGNRIYSKFPILRQGRVEGLTGFDAVYADIRMGNDTLRVYNLHLASNRFDQYDQAFLASLSSPVADAGHYKEGAARMLRKMREATRLRCSQIQQVMLDTRRASTPSRQILCGDLNDQPVSYVYAFLRKQGFSDAFVEQGKGFGQTYNGFFPSYRIDYILCSEGVQTLCFDIWKRELSDHRPISAVLTLQQDRPSGSY